MFRQTWFKKNKYGAKSTIYDGISYHSKLEAQYARDLDLRIKAKDIKSWERQVLIPINVYYDKKGNPILTDKDALEIKNEGGLFLHICNYYIDFVITHNHGGLEYVEVKGMELPVWRMKWKLTEAILGNRPDIELIVVK